MCVKNVIVRENATQLLTGLEGDDVDVLTRLNLLPALNADGVH
jgi:hypothetical protein